VKREHGKNSAGVGERNTADKVTPELTNSTGGIRGMWVAEAYVKIGRVDAKEDPIDSTGLKIKGILSSSKKRRRGEDLGGKVKKKRSRNDETPMKTHRA